MPDHGWLHEKAAKVSDQLLGTYGYSPAQNSVAAGLIRELSAELKAADEDRRWTDVDERLPSAGETVLFVIKSTRVVQRGRYVCEGAQGAKYFTTRIGRSNSGGTYIASHWMRLPEAPK